MESSSVITYLGSIPAQWELRMAMPKLMLYKCIVYLLLRLNSACSLGEMWLFLCSVRCVVHEHELKQFSNVIMSSDVMHVLHKHMK